jgi:hypothetical protein
VPPTVRRDGDETRAFDGFEPLPAAVPLQRSELRWLDEREELEHPPVVVGDRRQPGLDELDESGSGRRQRPAELPYALLRLQAALGLRPQ